MIRHDANTPGWRPAPRARVRGHHRHPARVWTEQEGGERVHEAEVRERRAVCSQRS